MGLKSWIKKAFENGETNTQEQTDTVKATPMNNIPKQYVAPTKAEQQALLKMGDEKAYKFIMNKLPEYVKLDDSKGYSNWWSKSGSGMMAHRPDFRYGYDYINLVDLYQYPNIELWGTTAFLGGYSLTNSKLRGSEFNVWRDKWNKLLK